MLVSLLPLTANLQDVWGVVAFTLFEGIWIKRSLHPAADTKKADRVSWVDLRIPKPPPPTRRVAWTQVK